MNRVANFLPSCKFLPTLKTSSLQPFTVEYPSSLPSLNPVLVSNSLRAEYPIFEFHGDARFQSIVQSCIHTLTESPIGLNLIQRVMDQKERIPIYPNAKGEGRYQIENKQSKIIIDLTTDLWLTTSRDDGTRFKFILPPFLRLGHELIHYLHYKEEGLLHTSSQYYEYPGFPNVEETYTVMGVKPLAYLQKFPERGPLQTTLSEHALCEAYQYPKRDVYGFFLPSSLNEGYRFGGFTALHIAAANGYLNAVKTLISRGAAIDIKASGGGGRTPLMCAVQYNRPETAKCLIEARADKGLKDIYGKTARDHLPLDAKPELLKLI